MSAPLWPGLGPLSSAGLPGGACVPGGSLSPSGSAVTKRSHCGECPLPEAPSSSAHPQNPNLPSPGTDHAKTIRHERSDPVMFTSGFPAFFRQPRNNFRKDGTCALPSAWRRLFFFLKTRRRSKQVVRSAPCREMLAMQLSAPCREPLFLLEQ